MMELVATWAMNLAFQSEGPAIAQREEKGPRTDTLSNVGLYTDFLFFLTEATQKEMQQEIPCP